VVASFLGRNMERFETPKNYEEFLKKKGGTNLFGEPRFILIWGKSPLYRLGIPETFIAPYLDAWCLAEWKPAETFGSPETWDSNFWKYPYPNRGLYIPIQVFKEQNKPVMLDSESLNPKVLELFLWVIMNYENDSLMKRKTFLKNEREQAEAKKNQQLIDQIEDGAPAFIDACSFSGQLNVNSVIKQKMEQIERNLGPILDVSSRFPRGGVVQGSIGG
jgi:hypothetical protein